MANEETKVVEPTTNETPLSESEKEQVQEILQQIKNFNKLLVT